MNIRDIKAQESINNNAHLNPEADHATPSTERSKVMSWKHFSCVGTCLTTSLPQSIMISSHLVC